MYRIAKLCVMGALIAPAAAAQQTPTLGEMLGASGLEVSGYVDASYMSSFDNEVAVRVFDTDRNDFNFNMAELVVRRDPEQGFGGSVVLNAGPDANVIAAAGTSNDDDFDVQQAFVSYNTGVARLMFGKFATLHGAEVIESPANLNFSRSFLFGFAIPFTHTGGRLTYAASDALTFGVGVNNGWDNLEDDNDQKSLETLISFAPSDFLAVSVQGISGREAGTTAQGTRNLIDVVVTLQATEDLTFTVNGDYGTQQSGTATGAKAKWDGIAVYADYRIGDLWHVALRSEFFNDQDGFRTGIDQKLKEATLTLGYQPEQHVEVRAEYRHDWSNEDAFDNGTSDDQDTVALEVIFKF